MDESADTYRVHGDRGYWLKRGLAAAAFAVACAVGLRHGAGLPSALAIAGLALFGPLALYALRQGVRTGPRLTVDALGLDAADLGVGRIAWSEVEHVQLFGSSEAPFLAVHVRDPAGVLARMPAWPRFMQRLLRAQGLPAFSVNLIGVDRAPTDVAARARARWSAAARP